MYVEGSGLYFAECGRRNAVPGTVRSHPIGKEKALSRKSCRTSETERCLVAYRMRRASVRTLRPLRRSLDTNPKGSGKNLCESTHRFLVAPVRLEARARRGFKRNFEALRFIECRLDVLDRYLLPLERIALYVVTNERSDCLVLRQHHFRLSIFCCRFRTFPDQIVNSIPTITNAVANSRNGFSESHFNDDAHKWLALFARDLTNSVGRLLLHFM